MSVVKLASRKAFKKMIEAAENGGDINELTPQGNSALYFAIKHESHSAIKYLITKGAKLYDSLFEDDNFYKICYTDILEILITKPLERSSEKIKTKMLSELYDIYSIPILPSLPGMSYEEEKEKEEKYNFISQLSFENGIDINIYKHKNLKNKELLTQKYNNYILQKSKERSDLLREELVSKYHSPGNIEKWSVYLHKSFDETIEVM
jgi:hypothetical protein